MSQEWISIEGARLHNLKNVSLRIPKNRLVVFTGLSGSGKSSLAIDTLHKEGQRQYLESLGLVDYMGRLPVDRITGLSPSISVDQHLVNRSPRSTVGTVTEIFTYLRVLYARLARRPCPHCSAELPPSYQLGAGLDWDDESGETGLPDDEGAPAAAAAAEEPFEQAFPCPACGRPVPELAMGNFSFNKPAGACPQCTGLGTVQAARVEKLVDEQKTIAGGAVYGWDIHTIKRNLGSLEAAARHFGFDFDLSRPLGEFSPAQHDLLLYGAGHPLFLRHFPGVKPPDARHRGLFEGVATNLLRRYAEHIHDAEYRQKLSEFIEQAVCPACQGARLRPQALQAHIFGQNIVQAAGLPLSELDAWLAALPAQLSPDDRLVAGPVLVDLHERLARLINVGVEYLICERASPSLSGGEAQRLRLAMLLGSGLTGVLYVLDEPTIGLHPR
ncbi:MAG: ABC-ATPase UvrA, partial [Chloroflexota bacterium]